MGNGCGGSGGFKFVNLKNRLAKLPLVNPKKLNKLYKRIEELCRFHDFDFEVGGNILDFIKANYNFSTRLIGLLHWTTAIGRAFIFIITFFPLCIFGIRYFNFN